MVFTAMILTTDTFAQNTYDVEIKKDPISPYGNKYNVKVKKRKEWYDVGPNNNDNNQNSGLLKYDSQDSENMQRQADQFGNIINGHSSKTSHLTDKQYHDRYHGHNRCNRYCPYYKRPEKTDYTPIYNDDRSLNAVYLAGGGKDYSTTYGIGFVGDNVAMELLYFRDLGENDRYGFMINMGVAIPITKWLYVTPMVGYGSINRVEPYNSSLRHTFNYGVKGYLRIGSVLIAGGTTKVTPISLGIGMTF
ncbi:hypothetical protein [Flammeovirga kamogawensis]|uniref:Porin family protein n=1 Tax=Flammeovirga kamogawensis TaxID=373891 RepID=A0ABX8GSY3_9BACT|nr:hypothetical protein [Flammeovirga kamogawensis]MBB6463324.1 hypothetical protein [Flammeovirga kamogawensis]QWG06703.1 hypothetical protein KM029_15510 [Flammeovirga kamogawensis]TRX68524.1 hypothetical protein EO216_10505 [Flammeovirga kamogawensis]